MNRDYIIVVLVDKKMSAEVLAVAADEVCASCGIAAVDDVKLKKCACNLVKYCSVACQKDHRPQHKKMCKKRVAELRDDKLFEKPERSCFGDCPICCLPLSDDRLKSTFMSCCSQLICNGCNYANQTRELRERLGHKCPFCREPKPKSKKEFHKRSMERIKKNDPVAMCQMGKHNYAKGNIQVALEYYTKAAELDEADAHYCLSLLYHDGEGVEKDMKKFFYHSEEAAIAGHPRARHNLGCIEESNRKFERAKKHYIIAANLGYEDSLKMLRTLYADGHASKDDYADALRAFQAALNAMKSPEREEAEEAKKRGDIGTFGGP